MKLAVPTDAVALSPFVYVPDVVIEPELPSVHDPTVARPLELVLWDPPVTPPPPALTLKDTFTPGTPFPN